MGKLKEWAMEDHLCAVCGITFVPQFVMHEIDIAVPTCSQHCNDEYHQVMNSIADMQEDERKP